MRCFCPRLLVSVLVSIGGSFSTNLVAKEIFADECCRSYVEAADHYSNGLGHAVDLGSLAPGCSSAVSLRGESALEEFFDGARKAAENRQYDDALPKYLCVFVYGINSSFDGVRSSFLLSEWAEVANAYLPADVALQNARSFAKSVVETNSPGAWNAFSDYEAINYVLAQNDRTAELFLWLDKENPQLAIETFDKAKPHLVEIKQIAIVNKYAGSAIEQYIKISDEYDDHIAMQMPVERQKLHLALGEYSYTSDVVELIQRLNSEGRAEEAEVVGRLALDKQVGSETQQIFEAALDGKVVDIGIDEFLRP